MTTVDIFGRIVVGKVNVVWITATLFKKHELNWLVTTSGSLQRIEKDRQVYFGGFVDNVVAHESNNNSTIVNVPNIDIVSVNSTQQNYQMSARHLHSNNNDM